MVHYCCSLRCLWSQSDDKFPRGDWIYQWDDRQLFASAPAIIFLERNPARLFGWQTILLAARNSESLNADFVHTSFQHHPSSSGRASWMSIAEATANKTSLSWETPNMPEHACFYHSCTAAWILLLYVPHNSQFQFFLYTGVYRQAAVTIVSDTGQRQADMIYIKIF